MLGSTIAELITKLLIVTELSSIYNDVQAQKKVEIIKKPIPNGVMNFKNTEQLYNLGKKNKLHVLIQIVYNQRLPFNLIIPFFEDLNFFFFSKKIFKQCVMISFAKNMYQNFKKNDIFMQILGKSDTLHTPSVPKSIPSPALIHSDHLPHKTRLCVYILKQKNRISC